MNKIIQNIIIIIIISICLPKDEIDTMIEKVLDGKITTTDNNFYQNINEVINKDSTNINALFLKGIIEENGENALSLFQSYYERNKDKKYNELTIKKIGDFNYSKGLYIQAAEWYKKIPDNYPKSSYLKSSINYYLNSLLVSGNFKEAEIAIKKYKKKFPQVNFNDITDHGIKESKNKPNKSNLTYSVLVGNYETYKAALNYKKHLSNEGFLCRIEDVTINGEKYYSLKIGYYKSDKTAQNILKRLKSRLGITNAVIVSN